MVRARTICLALTCALVAVFAPTDSAFAARRTPQQRRQRPVKKVTAPRPQRRQVSAHELNAFLRSPAGKTKLKVYKQQAFDVPRAIANKTGEKPFTSLRHQHQAYKTAGRITKIATFATSVVTGTMGAFFGQFLHMAGGGGGIPGPGAYQHPSVLHFLSGPHMLIGAAIGAGAVLVAGTMVSIKFKRAAKKVDRQAEDEAVTRILGEMELGMEHEPPAQHPAAQGQAAGGRGARGNRDILNDLWGGPGALFGPVESAADRASHSSGISDVGPSGFDTMGSFGSPGGPP
jgi:hypothetical protein